ncbi:MAG: DUF4147 domain-containing protein [Myxococcales bacterium]|nr:DUF4147 domain-containing protein [Myxococcales bacterium]
MSGRSTRDIGRALVQAALEAADPEAAVQRALRVEGEALLLGETRVALGDIERLVVVGGGKAGVPMARAASRALGARVDAGLVIVPHAIAAALPDRRVGAIESAGASHPVPDAQGLAAAQRLADLVDGLGEGDLVLSLISGGASALITAPREPLGLDDLVRTTELLLASGATIDEINCLRKHVESLKGGQLAARAFPARTLSLVLSDVVGSDLSTIASGPTVGDPTTFADALAIARRRDVLSTLPASVRELLEAGARGELDETPAPGDPRLERASALIVGSARVAAEAALERCSALGLGAQILTTFLEGEAREVGRALAAVLREIDAAGRPLARPCCLICAGETTVTLRGGGKGGRNQELALAAAPALAGLENVLLLTLASDGVDGPTDAAGAFVDGSTMARAAERGLDVATHLRDNNAYPLLEALGDLLLLGPTGTNVNDLTFLIAL